MHPICLGSNVSNNYIWDNPRQAVRMTDDTNTTDSGETTAPVVSAYDGPSISITEEMKTSYLDYAMSVIVSRAIPDLRDGLKPVHRRILYAMHETNNTHDKPYRKSSLKSTQRTIIRTRR